MTLDRRPGPVAVALVGLLATVAVVTTALGGVGVLFSVAGMVLLVVGTRQGASRQAAGGFVGLLLGVVVAGLSGATPEALLVATLAALLAWDAAAQAIDLAAMLGARASWRRALTVHVAATAVVGSVVAAVAYAVFRLIGGGRPVTALVLLLFGAITVAYALRE